MSYRTNSAPSAATGDAHERASGVATRALRSPGLDHFRANAFRVLRIPVRATAQEAVWAAEKARTLARAGLPRPGADVLPWLPEPDEIELQDATQRIEEPLRRLRDQLFWFDFETDPCGEMIRAALRALDPSAVSPALGLQPVTHPSGESGGLGAVPPGGGSAPAPPPPAPSSERLSQSDLEDTAQALNVANLRLLVGLAALHGRFAPEGLAGKTRAEPSATPPPRAASWETVDGVRQLRDVHAALGDGAAPRASAVDGASAASLLRDALASWGALLESPRLASFIAHAIEQLGDELLTAADAETLIEAMRTALADLVAAEARQLMMAGQVDRAAEVARAAHESGMDPRAWGAAFRPLRQLFQAELDDLAPLLEGTPPGARSIATYLTRLARLAARFRALDTTGVLGLDQLLDDAVARAFAQACALEASIPDAEIAARAGEIRQLVAQALEVTGSESLRQRMIAYQHRLEDATKYFCHFCHARPAGQNPVVLAGRKETGREAIGYNQWRVYYEIRRAVVLRCDACAEWHEWVRGKGKALGFVFAAGLVAHVAITEAGWLRFGVPARQAAVYYGERVSAGWGTIALLTAAIFFASAWRFKHGAAVVLAIVSMLGLLWFDAVGGLGAMMYVGFLRAITYGGAGAVVGIGLSRVLLSLAFNPRGMKHYWSLDGSEGFKTMDEGGYGGFVGNVSKDYDKGALERLKAGGA